MFDMQSGDGPLAHTSTRQTCTLWVSTCRWIYRGRHVSGWHIHDNSRHSPPYAFEHLSCFAVQCSESSGQRGEHRHRWFDRGASAVGRSIACRPCRDEGNAEHQDLRAAEAQCPCPATWCGRSTRTRRTVRGSGTNNYESVVTLDVSRVRDGPCPPAATPPRVRRVPTPGRRRPIAEKPA